jgi:DNA processing protein
MQHMLRHWLQLAMCAGIGPILIRRLLDAAGSAEAACAADATLLRSIEGIGRAKASEIAAAMRRAGDEASRELARAAAGGVSLICPDDATYPPLLKHIPDPPPVLYIKGALEPRDLNAIAIVGSRKCSFYGREQAERFASLLAGAAFTVISGGARGIDSAAHRGAIAHKQGRTIAVLGSGVDVPYPPENANLFDQIAQRGAVISEYPLGTPPLAENFPRRNRIVSGMSRGVLVIEADERSGALITARQACDDHGRPVFALPGRVDQSTSAGPHRLIREGAVLVTKLEDILEGLGPVPEGVIAPELFTDSASDEPTPEDVGVGVADQARDEVLLAALSDTQRVILAQMGSDALDVDALIERTELPAHQVLQELTFLSIKGMVRRVDGQSFVRSRAGGAA